MLNGMLGVCLEYPNSMDALYGDQYETMDGMAFFGSHNFGMWWK